MVENKDKNEIKGAFTGEGKIINSDFLNNLNVEQAKKE